MKRILITGANRGLGLEFVRQYAAQGHQLLAACRQPQQATALQALAQQHANIQIEALDVQDLAQIDVFASRLNGLAIDVLINNAGVYGDEPEHGFGNLDYARWQQTLLTNTIAPVKLSEALLPQLMAGQDKLIVAVSSLMGSIADNGSGGSLLYRSSKAGLNAVMHSLAIDLQVRGVGVLILHPGWVRTDMGGPNGLIDVEESVRGMCQCIDGFDPGQTGSFVKYDGTSLPW